MEDLYDFSITIETVYICLQLWIGKQIYVKVKYVKRRTKKKTMILWAFKIDKNETKSIFIMNAC